jgi:hypothetical protein
MMALFAIWLVNGSSFIGEVVIKCIVLVVAFWGLVEVLDFCIGKLRFYCHYGWSRVATFFRLLIGWYEDRHERILIHAIAERLRRLLLIDDKLQYLSFYDRHCIEHQIDLSQQLLWRMSLDTTITRGECRSWRSSMEAQAWEWFATNEFLRVMTAAVQSKD